MSEKFKPYDPKSQVLIKILQSDIFPHLKDWPEWETEIKEALNNSSDYQLEQDNFRLQGELSVAMSVIAEQEVKLKRQNELLDSYREVVSQVRDMGDKMQQLRVKNEYY